jgi:hypothetical protein
MAFILTNVFVLWLILHAACCDEERAKSRNLSSRQRMTIDIYQVKSPPQMTLLLQLSA